MNQKIYALLCLTSCFYAPLLSLWQRRDPITFNDYTWLTVVIGVGYTLLWLRFLLPLRAWLRVCAAFFVAALPIIARSLHQNICRYRRFHQFNGGGGSNV